MGRVSPSTWTPLVSQMCSITLSVCELNSKYRLRWQLVWATRILILGRPGFDLVLDSNEERWTRGQYPRLRLASGRPIGVRPVVSEGAGGCRYRGV